MKRAPIQGSSQQQTSTSAEQSMIEYKSINHGIGNTMDAREGGSRGQQQSLNEQQEQSHLLQLRLADLERELDETKAYYQAKLAHLDRSHRLLQQQPDLVASFGMPYGERQRFLDQLALVELDRDEARREAHILSIENRLLTSSLKRNSLPEGHLKPSLL